MLRQAFMDKEPVLRRSLLMMAMYSWPIIISMRITTRWFDPDSWWHLRTGQWIVEHRAVPFTDTFSIVGGAPWIAYSWLYDLLIYGLHSLWGLSSFVFFGVGMALLITVALYALLRELSGRVALSVALTAAGLAGMAPMLHIRSFTFSILFLILECLILSRARKKANGRILLLLPPLFLLWANLHIQFVYGLLCYTVWALDRAFVHKGAGPTPTWRQGKRGVYRLAGIGLACGLATLVNPYHVLIYAHLFEILRRPEFYQHVSELQSPGFRTLDSWAMLAVLLGAVFVAGRQKALRPHPLIFLGVAIFLGFRAQRDAWLVVVTGLIVIASHCAARGEREASRHSKFLVVVGMAVLFLFLWKHMGVSNQTLEERVARRYPVAAAAFVEERGYSGPIYNHFDWGGYLIWRLPKLVVSMDGRGYVYSRERFDNSVRTWSAKPGWQEDPDLIAARIIIGHSERPLTAVLQLDPRFELVYEDKVSSVFVPAVACGRELVPEEGALP